MYNETKPRRRLRDIENPPLTISDNIVGTSDMDGSVASANECTGLTATIPESEEAVESYKDIYKIPLSTDRNKLLSKGQNKQSQ